MTTMFNLHKAAEDYVLARFEQIFKKIDVDDDVKEMIMKANKEFSSSKKTSTKKEKKAQDPNKPKQPMNGFMRFMADCRKVKDGEKPSKNISDEMVGVIKSHIKKLKKGKEDGKGISSSELSTAMSVIWGDEKNSYIKKKYNKEVEKEKVIFKEKLAKYNNEKSDESDGENEKKKSKKSKKSKKEKVESDEEVESEEKSDTEEEEKPKSKKEKKGKKEKVESDEEGKKEESDDSDSENEKKVVEKKEKKTVEKKEEKTCQATTGKNELCGNKTKDGSDYCGRHKKQEEKAKKNKEETPEVEEDDEDGDVEVSVEDE